MATARNDITGDAITTKTSTDAFRDGWTRIYGDKKSKETPAEPEVKPEETKKD